MSSPSENTVPATLLRRLGAMIYDAILLIAVLIAAGGLVTWVLGDTPRDGDPFYFLYLLITGFLFYGLFWTRGGRTLGLQTWRLRLETLDGSPITLRIAVIRYLAAILSWAVAGLGFLWIMIDRDKRAWHDRLSGTRIVRLPKNAPDH
ncbi:MAG: RDD family protein [Gammaproteobacteria bacterium]